MLLILFALNDRTLKYKCDGRMQGTSAGGWSCGPQYHLIYIGCSTRSYHSAVSYQSVQMAGNWSIYSVVGGRMVSFYIERAEGRIAILC